LHFTITGKHIEITEAIKEYAEKKTSKLPKYYSSINRVEVILDAGDGGVKMKVEIIAHAEHSKIFVVSESGTDAYACIDVAVDKLEEQLRRKKTRERDNKHPGAEEE